MVFWRKPPVLFMVKILLMTGIFLSSLTEVLCENQGVFELRLKRLGFNLRQQFWCSENCRMKFRFCLKHYQKNVDPSQGCTFGEVFMPVVSTPVGIESVNSTVKFPLDFKWPGSFTLIIEAWQDDSTNQGNNKLISRLVMQEKLDSGDKWIKKLHEEKPVKIEIEYRMICSSHYYGNDCDTLCRPRDDRFGHYTCAKDGKKICLSGWEKDNLKKEGDYCTKAICKRGCDPEHGECDLPGQCRCKPGWTGFNCSECIRYPGCVHGSCNKPQECICNEGWGGLFCNQDLNYCTNHKPCLNGATCRNTGQGSYTCSCQPGYTGTNCATRIINECGYQPCLNGGTCQGSSPDDYMCICPLGFHGLHCEKRAKTCDDAPCKNGATCSDTNEGSYRCECLLEYQGVNCDVKIDHCRASPCQNGGTCVSQESGNKYLCKCPIGFSGIHCEKNIDDCASNPCLNGGTCFDFVNDFKCYCHAGFVGRYCEDNVDECVINPCTNGGTCHDSINDFVCTCKPGYSGKDCSQEINECANSPCLHGFCIDKLNDFECRCLPGYSGKNCNILPDGTILRLGRLNDLEQETEDTANVHLSSFLACSITILTFIILLMFCLCLKKRRHRLEQERYDKEAKKENELNAVYCFNKNQLLLDDHRIINSLDYPIQDQNNMTKATSDELEEAFQIKHNCNTSQKKHIPANLGHMLSEKFGKSFTSEPFTNCISGPSSSSKVKNDNSSSSSDTSTVISSGYCSVSSNMNSSNINSRGKAIDLPTASSVQTLAKETSKHQKSLFRDKSLFFGSDAMLSSRSVNADHFATEV